MWFKIFHNIYSSSLSEMTKSFTALLPENKVSVKSIDNKYIWLEDISLIPKESVDRNTEKAATNSSVDAQKLAKRKMAISEESMNGFEQQLLHQDQSEIQVLAQMRGNYDMMMQISRHDASLKRDFQFPSNGAFQATYLVSRRESKEEMMTLDQSDHQILSSVIRLEKSCNCFRNLVDIDDELASADFDDRRISLTPEKLIPCLEPKATLNNEDNILHCVLGKSNMFGTYSAENCSAIRVKLANILKQFLADSDKPIVTVEPYLHWFIKTSNHYKKFANAKKENMKSELMTQNCELSLGAFKNSTSDEGVIKFIESCPALLTLKSIKKSLTSFKYSNQKFFVKKYIEYILDEGQRLGIPILQLVAEKYHKRIHLYVETDNKSQNNLEYYITFERDFTTDYRKDTVYILMKKDGTFCRLEKNKQIHDQLIMFSKPKMHLTKYFNAALRNKLKGLHYNGYINFHIFQSKRVLIVHVKVQNKFNIGNYMFLIKYYIFLL